MKPMSEKSDRVSKLHVLPMPASVSVSDEVYQVPSQLVIGFTGPQPDSLVSICEEFLGAFLSLSWSLDADCETWDIALTFEPQLVNEAYRLVISKVGILIESGSPAGTFYGLQTLRQLLRQHSDETAITLPCLSIEDVPRFAYRGMHLDVSRHFFDVPFVKRYIDLIAMYKLNVFHWHLTDDAGWRIDLSRFPKLKEIGSIRAGTVQGFTLDAGATTDGITHSGCYSPDDITEVIEYAASRHVTVIPEVDVPGHASSLLAAYPELGCSGQAMQVPTHFGIFEDVLCTREATFSFLRNVFEELATLFPGPYIHIGGDEVLTSRWRKCPDCQRQKRRLGLSTETQLQSYFMGRIAAMIKDLGKTPVAWDDVVEPELAGDITIMSWLGGEKLGQALRQHHPVIMCPTKYAYFDFYQSHNLDEYPSIHGLTRLHEVYEFDPESYAESQEQKASILGGQANLWTEYVATEQRAHELLLPRMLALSETLWSPCDAMDWRSFKTRLPTHEKQLRRDGYAVATSHYKPHISASEWNNGAISVTIDAYGMPIVYTLDGTPPTANSARYDQPLLLSSTTTIRAASLLENNELHGDARLTVVRHLGLLAEIEFPQFSQSEASCARARLFSGRLASDLIFDYPHWYRCDGCDLDVIARFDQPTEVSRVRIGFDAGAHRKLHRPCQIRVDLFDLESGWHQVAAYSEEDLALCGAEAVFKFAPKQVTAVRLNAENREKVWSHEMRRLVAKTLYFDEVVIL
jgi:hexosaminidase